MIKSILIVFISISLFSACKSDSKPKSFADNVKTDLSKELDIPTKDGEVDTAKMAQLTFESPVFDFGKIKEGEVINHTFKFKNTGTKTLFLLYHKTTCGCTVPTFSKDPYPPGATGEIEVAFDSKGKKLSQNKKIKIFANTFPNMTTITVKGYVIPKEQ